MSTSYHEYIINQCLFVCPSFLYIWIKQVIEHKVMKIKKLFFEKIMCEKPKFIYEFQLKR